jgi:hypothetical protein
LNFFKLFLKQDHQEWSQTYIIDQVESGNPWYSTWLTELSEEVFRNLFVVWKDKETHTKYNWEIIVQKGGFYWNFLEKNPIKSGKPCCSIQEKSKSKMKLTFEIFGHQISVRTMVSKIAYFKIESVYAGTPPKDNYQRNSSNFFKS